MKIALLGYGKMGKTIEKWALERGDTVVYKKTRTTQEGTIEEADIAIEFSSPEAAVANILFAFSHNISVVCGSTGWLKDKPTIEKEALHRNIAFIYASNFSVGVNLFFNLNEQLATLMQPWEMYTPAITEIHHTEKKDAPSGTAITLAEGIIPHTKATSWSLENKNEAVLIKAKREHDVKGTHTIEYSSEVDTISITHQAHTRDGFAKGALIAAHYIKDKKGIFTMKEVLGL